MRSEYSYLNIFYGSSFFQDKATTTHKARTSTTAELLNQASSAGAKSLRHNHANAPQLSRAAQALILRPKGRPIKLQEDMGLASNRDKFLCIRVRRF